jgi:phage baseplate assembly protein W
MPKYSDFDISFLKNPKSKDVYKLTDLQSIKQSLKNLIQTNLGERLFQPEIGINLRALLFENSSDAALALTLQEDVKILIRNYEPRVKVETVRILPENNSISVSIKYSIKPSTDLQEEEFYITN